jgi:hypothetical protein
MSSYSIYNSSWKDDSNFVPSSKDVVLSFFYPLIHSKKVIHLASREQFTVDSFDAKINCLLPTDQLEVLVNTRSRIVSFIIERIS